jgi:hypothetical protein
MGSIMQTQQALVFTAQYLAKIWAPLNCMLVQTYTIGAPKGLFKSIQITTFTNTYQYLI